MYVKVLLSLVDVQGHDLIAFQSFLPSSKGKRGATLSQNRDQNTSHSPTSATSKRQLGRKSLGLWTKYLTVVP